MAGQILRLQQAMRQRAWQAANVRLKTVTLDTDTTVHTLFGHQMGGRKGYNPKNKGRRSDKPLERSDGSLWTNYKLAEAGLHPGPVKRRPGDTRLHLAKGAKSFSCIHLIQSV